ncbi:hypothetical protein [Brevundimonas sp. NIBR11]|uniref:hypothetical protein n=1 Tax=Brevundimonas sp. NIBR11 TaxID=3015999 RepID=UPI0022F0C14C|nr:hypothetical protein [Brevundimonas sp. NIBR11]WGM29837.1 hypothetical protein KKHFBJBL_00045 [Brevundimonas sp. NIBR11]
MFMSVLYPTINSKGIRRFEQSRQSQTAGLLLFFTYVSAVLVPLAMGLLGDTFGDATFSLSLGTASILARAGLAV